MITYKMSKQKLVDKDGKTIGRLIDVVRDRVWQDSSKETFGMALLIDGTEEPEQREEKAVDHKDTHQRYRIVIESDGTTTTARMEIDGREVKTAQAKRNPNDKPNWRVGAETAFDRLWETEREQRHKHMTLWEVLDFWLGR